MEMAVAETASKSLEDCREEEAAVRFTSYIGRHHVTESYTDSLDLLP
jgi:hypothetical protein